MCLWVGLEAYIQLLQEGRLCEGRVGLSVGVHQAELPLDTGLVIEFILYFVLSADLNLLVQLSHLLLLTAQPPPG